MYDNKDINIFDEISQEMLITITKFLHFLSLSLELSTSLKEDRSGSNRICFASCSMAVELISKPPVYILVRRLLSHMRVEYRLMTDVY